MRPLLLAILTLLALADPAGAAITKSWVGGLQGDWGVAGNWFPAGVPGSTDVVSLGGNVPTVTVRAPATAAGVDTHLGGRLIIDGTTLTLSGAGEGFLGTLDIVHGGELSWGGTGRLEGPVTLADASAIKVPGAMELTAAVSGDGTMSVTGAATVPQFEVGSVDARFEGNASVAGSMFVRDGSGTVAVTGTLSVLGDFALAASGSGEVTVGAGTVTTSSLAVRRVQLGGRLDVTGSHSIGELDGSGTRGGTGTLTVTGDGSGLNGMRFASGTTRFAGDVSWVAASVAGDVRFDGATEWAGGSLEVSGGVENRGTMTFHSNPALQGEGTLLNTGTLTATSSLFGAGRIENRGNVEIRSGIFGVGGGTYRQTAGETVVAGELRKAVTLAGGTLRGGGTVATLANTGGVVRPEGTLTVSGAYSQGGTLRTGVNDRLVAATAALGGTLELVAPVAGRHRIVSGTRSGTFATVTGNDLGGGRRLFPDYLADGVELCETSATTNCSGEADSDSDGVVDTADNCPNVANGTQADQDSDGTGDACDPDRDGDGVVNDNCPADVNPDQADFDNDAQGDECDPDDDNDGLGDFVDDCPRGPCEEPTVTPTVSPTPTHETPAAVAASFRPSKYELRPNERIVLDASLSGPTGAIASYKWDLNGDHKTDIDCDGHAPVLSTLLAAGGDIRLTVTDTLGHSTNTQIGVAVKGQPLAPPPVPKVAQGLFAAKPKYTPGLCQATLQDYDATENGGPPPGCADEFVYENIKAVGCFKRGAEHIPVAERKIIEPWLLAVTDLGKVLGCETKKATASQAGTCTVKQAQQQELFDVFMWESVLVADDTVRINGLDVDPAPGAAIVLIAGGLYKKREAQLISANAKIAAGLPGGRQMPLQAGKLTEKLVPAPNVPTFPDLKFDRKFELVPGIGLEGHVKAELLDFGLKLTVSAKLPRPIDINVDATLKLTNSKGLELESFKVEVKNVSILGLFELPTLKLEYEAEHEGLKHWIHGKAALKLFGTAIEGELEFANGGFRQLLMYYEPPPPGIPIAPLVHLGGIGGGFTLDPFEIKTRTKLTIGPSAGCPKLGMFPVDMTLRFGDPVSLTLEGESQVLCWSVSKLRAYIDTSGYAEFSGEFKPKLDPLPVEVSGKLQGQLDLDPLRAQLDIDGKVCFKLSGFGSGCVGGETVISDKAMGFCGDFGFTHAGLGFKYPPLYLLLNPPAFFAWLGPNLKIMFSSCNIAQFRTMEKKAAAAQAGATSFALPAGEDVAVIGLVGSGDAPRVVLRGPGGRTIDVPDAGMLKNGNEAAFRFDHDDTTYVLINHARAGRWTAELKPGSAPITSVRYAPERPDPEVRVKVRRGVLTYSTTDTVRFYERVAPRGGQFLGERRRGSGRMRFTPADTPGRKRTIVAQVVRDGIPMPALTVARFTAGPAKIGRASAVRVRGRVLTWRRAANATTYRVIVRLGDGRERLLTPRAPRVTLPIGARTVEIRGMRPGPRVGPAVRARLSR